LPVQDEVVCLEREHSQQLSRLQKHIEALEQEIVVSAAARMAAMEHAEASSADTSRLQTRLAELEAVAPPSESRAQYPPLPPPPPVRDAALPISPSAVRRKERLSVRADEDAAPGWGSDRVIYSRPQARQARAPSREKIEGAGDEEENEGPYVSESRDEAWERMHEEVRQASETTIMMAVAVSNNGVSRSDLADRSSTRVRARGSVPGSGERQDKAVHGELVLGPVDLERIRALLQLLHRRVALEQGFVFRCWYMFQRVLRVVRCSEP
jgi:hypothetical protein